MADSREWERSVVARAGRALGGHDALDGELEQAYSELFARNYARVYAICRYWTDTEERAAELAQETMLEGHRKLLDYRGDARFGTWLCGIAKMKALNERRKKRDFLSEDGLLQAEGIADTLGAMTASERAGMVRDCIDQLPPEDADFAHARWIEQMAVAEIEALFELPKGQGRVAQQRCRRKLEKLFGAWLDEHGHGLSFIRTTVRPSQWRLS